MKIKKTFNENDLDAKTRIFHLSQEKWRNKNWKETLQFHGSDIEILIEKIYSFDKWENILQNDYVFKLFIPEKWVSTFSHLCRRVPSAVSEGLKVNYTELISFVFRGKLFILLVIC